MKKHILLIEQCPQGYKDFMEVLAAINIDCKVTYTKDYRHGLEMLNYLSPDCIFMRIDINEERAIECVKAIRDHPTLKASKLIVFDDEVTSSMIRRAISEGADYCIDRPSSYGDINHLIKDVFNLN